MEKNDDLPSGQRIWELSSMAVRIENSAKEPDSLSYEPFEVRLNAEADRAMRTMDPVERRFFAACFQGVYVPSEQRGQDWQSQQGLQHEDRSNQNEIESIYESEWYQGFGSECKEHLGRDTNGYYYGLEVGESDLSWHGPYNTREEAEERLSDAFLRWDERTGEREQAWEDQQIGEFGQRQTLRAGTDSSKDFEQIVASVISTPEFEQALMEQGYSLSTFQRDCSKYASFMALPQDYRAAINWAEHEIKVKAINQTREVEMER
jgi:hypothetical protein